MSEKPILFSGPMVRAILEGRKTQTRRVIQPQPSAEVKHASKTGDGRWCFWPNEPRLIPCPYGGRGDTLWVRETWAVVNGLDHVKPSEIQHTIPVVHRASSVYPNDPSTMWRPSIYMPRWASRITLEITDVRVERVQDISKEDARAEGVELDGQCATYRAAFFNLWDSINAKRGFGCAVNPWVWVVSFSRSNHVEIL